FCFLGSYSQESLPSLGLWHLQAFSGEVELRGVYRQQQFFLTSDNYEFQKSSLFGGGIDFNSRSYIWHPSFFLFDIDAGFKPETRQEQYLVIPDRSEARTLKKLNIKGTVFDKKFISLNTYINFNQSYNNRENLSNIETNTKDWGGSVNLRSRFIPITVHYSQREWDQKEFQTGRIFTSEQSKLQSRISKSFTSRDKNNISFSHNEFYRKDANAFETKSIIDKIDLNNNILLGSGKNLNFNSRISYFNQQGSANLIRFLINENLLILLPKNFSFTSTYNFNNNQQDLNKLVQNQTNLKLSHKLYKSLTTSVFYENNNLKHSSYEEIDNKSSFNINYTKKLRLEGSLSVSYQYINHSKNKVSAPIILQTLGEAYVLSDDQIVLIISAFVEIETIVVRDFSGTIIYQENLDYILIQRNDYIEIQRMPGGQIANGAMVYIDYKAVQEGSFSYDGIYNNLSASITLFKQLIEVYYRYSKNNFINIEQSDLLTLNYFSQNVYGSKVFYRFISGGVEYDNYQSSLIPYKMSRFYVSLQKKFGRKTLLSLNGNIRNYLMLNENINQKFSDITGQLAYQINYRTKFNIDAGYRNQKGPGVDLELLTARSVVTMALGNLFLSAGFDIYNRHYLDEKIIFNGGFFQLTRKF
ncbi:hypothetical protein ACFLQ9_00925, partial [Bacteroidota bacterium]